MICHFSAFILRSKFPRVLVFIYETDNIKRAPGHVYQLKVSSFQGPSSPFEDKKLWFWQVVQAGRITPGGQYTGVSFALVLITLFFCICLHHCCPCWLLVQTAGWCFMEMFTIDIEGQAHNLHLIHCQSQSIFNRCSMHWNSIMCF